MIEVRFIVDTANYLFNFLGKIRPRIHNKIAVAFGINNNITSLSTLIAQESIQFAQTCLLQMELCTIWLGMKQHWIILDIYIWIVRLILRCCFAVDAMRSALGLGCMAGVWSGAWIPDSRRSRFPGYARNIAETYCTNTQRQKNNIISKCYSVYHR